MKWAKMRWQINHWHYLMEALFNPVSIVVVYSLFRHNLESIYILVSVISAKVLIDTSINMILQSKIKWYHYALIPVKDLIIGIIWYLPYFSKKVIWRGNVFKIRKDTILTPSQKEYDMQRFFINNMFLNESIAKLLNSNRSTLKKSIISLLILLSLILYGFENFINSIMRKVNL